MMKGVKWGVAILVVTLCGCQHMVEAKKEYIRNHSKDYLHSPVCPPLDVPQDLSQLSMDETFPLPENIPDAHTLPHVSLKPPGFGQLNQIS